MPVKTITAIAVAASVAIPLLCLPIGTSQIVSASSKVRKAYDKAFPSEKKADEILVEDWALVGSEGGEQGGSQEIPDGLIDLSNGGTVQATYLDGQGPSSYESHEFDDVPAFTVYQQYDSAGLPKELIDPQYFAPCEEDLYIKADQSILKELPDMDSSTVAQLVTSDMVTRIGVGDQWSKIRTEDGQEGYVLSNTLSYEMVWIAIDRYVWVDTGSLMLRAEPSTESEIVKTLYDEQKLHCVEISDKWFHVFTMDGQEGYVYISFTTQTPPPTPTPTPVPRRSSGGGGGSSGGGGGGGGRRGGTPVISGVNPESVVSICESMLGVPYVWNGESADGVDCSGLVVYTYRQLGVGLPHFADSIASCGQEVSRADIRPGDVVCYDYGGGYCGHVGIYVGGGQVIHASNSRGNVRYAGIDMMSVLTIRRMIS